LSHSLKKGIPPLKNLFTSFFQTMSIPALPPQTASSLVFRDFLMGLEPLKKHALRVNRFKQPWDAGHPGSLQLCLNSQATTIYKESALEFEATSESD
jgi:hypothetical protein